MMLGWAAMAAFSSAPCLRARAITPKPSAASLLAMARPTPREPPDTRTLRAFFLSMTRQLSARGQVQLFDKADHGGHLESGQFLAAKIQQGLAEIGVVVGGPT